MGLCSSSGASEDDIAVAKSDDLVKEQEKEVKKLSPEEQAAADLDFVETLQTVTRLILHQLCTALEYEKEGFDDLRKKRNLGSYMDLIAPANFESLLRSWFDTSSEKDVEVDPSFVSYKQAKFMALLAACEEGGIKDGLVPATMLESLQEAVQQSQKEMEASIKASDASDLKIHLIFFSKCLDFCKGDLMTNYDRLYEAVDALTNED